jgi:hypothetical protein
MTQTEFNRFIVYIRINPNIAKIRRVVNERQIEDRHIDTSLLLRTHTVLFVQRTRY